MPGDAPNPFSPPEAGLDAEPVAAREPDPMLADVGQRLFAYIVDLGCTVGAVFGCIALVGALGLSKSGLHSPLLGLGLVLVVQAWLVASTGQSIGKRWLRTRIVRMDGSPCGLMHGFLLRELMKMGLNGVPKVGPLLALVNVLPILRDDRRALHDRLAGTKVVRIEARPTVRFE